MKTAKEIEIYEWLKNQNYQTEIGEQEYRMYYDVDMPKILEAYHESRMKEELKSYNLFLYSTEDFKIHPNSIDDYLATRKNK